MDAADHITGWAEVGGDAFDQASGDAAWRVIELRGSEVVNAAFRYDLMLRHLGARAPDVGAMVGRDAALQLDVPGPDGASRHRLRPISGMVWQAELRAQDREGSLVRVQLRPRLCLARKRRDCRVFRDLDVVQILQQVLKPYQHDIELRLRETYPRRDYQAQFNESDLEFFARLTQEWGINYHFEHSVDGHVLVLADHNAAYRAQPVPGWCGVHYRPRECPSTLCQVRSIASCETLCVESWSVRDHDYTRPRAAMLAQEHRRENLGIAVARALCRWRGDPAGDFSQPLAGADSRNQTEADGSAIARVRLEQARQARQRVRGSGPLRGLSPGFQVRLHDHPDAGGAQEYIVVAVNMHLRAAAHGAEGVAARGGVPVHEHVNFELHPREVVMRPEAVAAKPRVRGVQSARIAAQSSGRAVCTDHLARVAVRFPWHRDGAAERPDSARIRLLSAWAGNKLGMVQTPRPGQDVLVGFVDGDPDLPIGLGPLPDLEHAPPWPLPETSTLSGCHSRELGHRLGSGNFWAFDDGQTHLRATLHSDAHACNLHLGSLHDGARARPGDAPREAGWELTTSGHAAVRAGKGLACTTQAQPLARGIAADVRPAALRLEDGVKQASQTSEFSRGAAALPGPGHSAWLLHLKADSNALQAATAERERSEAPHVLLDSAATLAAHAGASVQLCGDGAWRLGAAGRVALAAATQMAASAVEGLQLLARRAGMTLCARLGPISLGSHHAGVELVAARLLQILSNERQVRLTASRGIHVQAGGSNLRLGRSGIALQADGVCQVHARQRNWSGPALGSGPAQSAEC